MKLSQPIVLITLTFLIACQEYSGRQPGGLAREYAEYRAARVSNVSYDLDFRLAAEAEDFEGAARITFDWNAPGEALTIDFQAGTVHEVVINDQATTDFTYNDSFIGLPAGTLDAGRNTLTVRFAHPYSRTGNGLYRFRDPEDGRIYLFSDLQPYDANRIFPCFDQPDLKADYAIRVNVPADWNVITARRENRVESVPEEPGRRIWHFERTPYRFSTYIFALHAGHYEYSEDPIGAFASPGPGGRIPMRLYYRKSLAPYVDHAEWFLITRQGFVFFQDYFDRAYPYEKYDQLIVPDFNAGAMENVGAVTFNERYAPRGAPTRSLRERRANVILHELAHMWFGNLVTNKWWDDLWLNESFATYLAYLALAEATEFDSAWRSFFARTKQWAYSEDERVTTHPIVADVTNTAVAFANFDGITYGKGAASLKQLAFLLEPNVFRDGVRAYIAKHADGNTVMSDFMGALGTSAARDLGGWTDHWLRTSGTNTVEARLGCADGKLNELELIQSAPADHPTLREHSLQVAFYMRTPEGGLSPGRTLRVTLDPTPSTKVKLPEPDGIPCPVLVYPNHDDHGFVRVRLDDKSLQAALDGWETIGAPLERSMVWQSLWRAVRAGELPPGDLALATLRGLPGENDPVIARQISRATFSLLYFLDATPIVPGTEPPPPVYRRFEAVFQAKLKSAPPGSPIQKRWFSTFLSVAYSPAQLEYLTDLLAGRTRLPGLVIDQDRRWSILRRLSLTGYPGTDALRESEARRDPSASGAKAALAVEALRPRADVKTIWFDRVSLPVPAGAERLSLAQERAVIGGLFPREQRELQRNYAEAYFERLPRVAAERDENFLRSFVWLTPTFCDDESVRRLERFNSAHPNLPPVARKVLLIAHQEDARCRDIRAAAEK